MRNSSSVKSEASAGKVASKTVSEILSQLGGSIPLTGEAGKAGVKLVATGSGLPALSKKLVEKISGGQYT